MTSWSFSSYSAALQCLRKYKYLYVDNIKPEENSAALAFGSAIHLGVNGLLLKENGAEMFELYWDNEKKKPLQYDRDGWSDLKEMGLNFLSKFDRLHSQDFDPAYMEVRLYAEYKGIKLEGTVDFAGNYKGAPSLLDFKTTSWAYDKSKVDIALQLYLYAYLCIANGYSPEQIIYFPFVKGSGSIQKPLIKALSKERMTKALDEMAHYVSIMEKQSSYPENWNSCIIGKNKCSFWGKCHGGKE